jgi:hypothetical protein
MINHISTYYYYYYKCISAAGALEIVLPMAYKATCQVHLLGHT